ncbi:predicted protein [Lodderomyces elongisporus NRRL YB-4239]|uniref:Uncharacterized protein n=1 Tax=Lodderomyces elongisporus (strain ATCC 11503 / CBS 2605 / JCM 1781 / NBRC 1676 / NRRL YB-4239) TaxID=379508 RepID=A5E291_LODEL|nr:predicted protein [Lodderomyces elongisporus NRRL YB-4239]
MYISNACTCIRYRDTHIHTQTHALFLFFFLLLLVLQMHPVVIVSPAHICNLRLFQQFFFFQFFQFSNAKRSPFGDLDGNFLPYFFFIYLFLLYLFFHTWCGIINFSTGPSCRVHLTLSTIVDFICSSVLFSFFLLIYSHNDLFFESPFPHS